MSCPELRAATVPEGTPEPTADRYCGECWELGNSMWVHLRLCLTCGHVACCDSSPHGHASAHYRATGHPVMRSYEPGEDWRWCFVHELIG